MFYRINHFEIQSLTVLAFIRVLGPQRSAEVEEVTLLAVSLSNPDVLIRLMGEPPRLRQIRVQMKPHESE